MSRRGFVELVAAPKSTVFCHVPIDSTPLSLVRESRMQQQNLKSSDDSVQHSELLDLRTLSVTGILTLENATFRKLVLFPSLKEGDNHSVGSLRRN
jgi:hypothetical protein